MGRTYKKKKRKTEIENVKNRNRKSEPHHKILHIQISLGTKFRAKLTPLIFWIKLTQKGYLQIKKKK